MEMRILRFMTRADAHAGALVLLRKEPAGWQVVIPEPERPRIYREYPLRGSAFLSVNFILDGKFDPDQERSRLLMSDDDRRLVQEALSAAVVGVSKAIADQWRDAHLLARAIQRQNLPSTRPTRRKSSGGQANLHRSQTGSRNCRS